MKHAQNVRQKKKERPRFRRYRPVRRPRPVLPVGIDINRAPAPGTCSAENVLVAPVAVWQPWRSRGVTAKCPKTGWVSALAPCIPPFSQTMPSALNGLDCNDWTRCGNLASIDWTPDSNPIHRRLSIQLPVSVFAQKGPITQSGIPPFFSRTDSYLNPFFVSVQSLVGHRHAWPFKDPSTSPPLVPSPSRF